MVGAPEKKTEPSMAQVGPPQSTQQKPHKRKQKNIFQIQIKWNMTESISNQTSHRKTERKKERKKESKNWQGPATAAPKRRNMRENDFRLFIRIRYQGPLKSSIQNQLLSRINHGQLVPRNDID